MAELKEAGAGLGTKANTFQLAEGDTFVCQGENDIGNGVVRPLGGVGGTQVSEIRLNAPFSIDLDVGNDSFALSAYVVTMFGGASEMHNGKTLRVSIRTEGIIKGIKKTKIGVWKNSIDFVIEALSPLTRHSGQFGFAEEAVYVNLGKADGNTDFTIYCEIVNVNIVSTAVVHVHKYVETNMIVQNQPYTYSRGARMPIRVFFKDSEGVNMPFYSGQRVKIWLTLGKDSIEVPSAPEWPEGDPTYTQDDYELDYAATVYAGALRLQKESGDGFTTTIEELIKELPDGTIGFDTEVYPEIYPSDYAAGVPVITSEAEPDESQWSPDHSYKYYNPWGDIPPLGEHDLKTLVCHIEVVDTNIQGYGLSKISDKPPHILMVICDESEPVYYPHGDDTFYEDLQLYRTVSRYGMRIEPNTMKDPVEFAALEDAKIAADIEVLNLMNNYNILTEELAAKIVNFLQKQAESDADPADPAKASAALTALVERDDAQQAVDDALLALQEGQADQLTATQTLEKYDGIAYGDLLYNSNKRFGAPRIADRREKYVNELASAESELSASTFLMGRAQVRYDAIDPTNILQKEVALAVLNDWVTQVGDKTQIRNSAMVALDNYDASITPEEIAWEAENPDERPTIEEIWSCSRGTQVTVMIPGGRYMWGADIMPRNQLLPIDFKITECEYSDSNTKSTFVDGFNLICAGSYPKMVHILVDMSKDKWIFLDSRLTECMKTSNLGVAYNRFSYWLDRFSNYGNHPELDNVENIPVGIIYHNNHVQHRSHNTFSHERWLKAAYEYLTWCFERKFEASLNWWDHTMPWVPDNYGWYYAPTLTNNFASYQGKRY